MGGLRQAGQASLLGSLSGVESFEAVFGDGSKGVLSYTEVKRRLTPEGIEVD